MSLRGTIRRWRICLRMVSILLLVSYAGAARVVRFAVKENLPSRVAVEVIHQTGSWCIAKSGATETQLQNALDWACGKGTTLGNVDCSAISNGGVCYNPNTIQDHASYAFNLYYQSQNQQGQACNFNGAAQLTTTDPSSGSCTYPSNAVSVSGGNGNGTGNGNGNGNGTGTGTGNGNGNGNVYGNGPISPTSFSNTSIGSTGSVGSNGIGPPADVHIISTLLFTSLVFLVNFLV